MLASRIHFASSSFCCRCRDAATVLTLRSSCSHANRTLRRSASASQAATGQQPIALQATAKDIAAAKGKLRLDAFISTHVPDVSRTKAQTAVDGGWVLVNGVQATKAGAAVKPGDIVLLKALPQPPPLQAVPEAIPLDIVYEDEHLMVINKAAGMVVHISAGHHTGTLVNALLHHCGLPGLSLDQVPSGSPGAASQQPGDQADDRHSEEGDEDAPVATPLPQLPGSGWQGDEASTVLRPGIVHRLDKGTSGLLVVAKQEPAHRALCDQFKERSVGREYLSITLGCPGQQAGRVETNIDRDPNDRKRMAALAYGATRGRTAASNYSVQEVLAGGNAALVRWKLDTGRTHQIRVHAKHLGYPLLGDDTYGGSVAAGVAALAKGKPSKQQLARDLSTRLGRPALHARTLAFVHPATGQRLSFEAEPPSDFVTTLQALRLF